jgi:hypothetical protein
MDEKKQPTTAAEHLRALLDSLDRNEHWSREQTAAVRAAEEFLGKKGKEK